MVSIVNNFKVMDSGVSLVAWKTQNMGFFETKTLIYLWAEDIQRQLASMSRTKNIWEGVAIKPRKTVPPSLIFVTFTSGTYFFKLILHTS